MDRGHSFVAARSADFICERGDGNEVKAVSQTEWSKLERP
jgi:hypothetical protein